MKDWDFLKELVKAREETRRLIKKSSMDAGSVMDRGHKYQTECLTESERQLTFAIDNLTARLIG